MDNKENFDESTCVGCLNKQLRLASILPTREKTELFVDSQWSLGGISVTYVIYRVSVAVLMIAWVVADLCVEAGGWYSFNYGIWFVFATNWSLLFLVLSSTVMAVSTTYYFVLVKCGRHDERDLRQKSIGGGLMFQWILYNIASNTSIVVSISYWAFVTIIDGSGFLTTPMSQLKHTLNSVYVIVDIFINAIPFRILHLVYPLAVGLIYAIFNAVYFINDGVGPNGRHYAYYVLDWRNPLGSTVTCFLGLIVNILIHGILYGFYHLRMCFYRKLVSAVDEELQTVLPKDNRDADDETGLFPRNVSGPNYRSVDDFEMRNG